MNIFLTADTHFSHAKVCTFKAPDGSPLRPWDDVEEMDEALVENWNRTVGPKDKVYHLGDVAIQRKGLKILDRLNGDKVLIKGNHDIFKLSDYYPRFRDIRAYWVLDKYAFSHVPVHPDALMSFSGNVHGHLHGGRVLTEGQIDSRYVCVCVEQTNFAPIAWEDVKLRFNKL
jgi:calcineurin-like phosphoesterase family protein